MRFKKGSKVEVLIKSSVPSGAWRSGEIISGNGHYYTVMFDGNVDTLRVPRNCMRPKPPPFQVLDSWAPGDILEVFENRLWKMAIISRVLEKDCFLIRLLGSSLKVKATRSDIRVRQSWKDNKWVMIGQGNSRSSTQSLTGKPRRKVHPKDEYISSESKDKLNRSHIVSSKDLKKRESHNQARRVEEEEEEEDRDSVVASSVGSCSMDMVAVSPVETGNSSDTESSSCVQGSIKKLRFATRGYETDDVHRLELDAYRCSMERLHASGPIITWEQETWITNLRLRLHISNEEHLMQIKNLISDDNSATYR